MYLQLDAISDLLGREGLLLAEWTSGHAMKTFRQKGEDGIRDTS